MLNMQVHLDLKVTRFVTIGTLKVQLDIVTCAVLRPIEYGSQLPIEIDKPIYDLPSYGCPGQLFLLL